MIEVIGVHMTKRRILEDVKDATLLLLMADEVTSHNQEQMPLVLRFVDKSRAIREEFIEFIPLKTTTGSAIASEICKPLVNVD